METKGEYLTADQQAILARLLEVFTWDQLGHIADAMKEATARSYGRIEIEMNNERMFIWSGKSRDGGRIKGR